MGEEEANAKLMYSVDGKNFSEIQKLQILSCDEIETTPLDDYVCVKPMHGSFECCSMPFIKLLKNVYGELIMFQYYQSIKSNNWLRRHGLPMRRKLR